MNMEDQAAAFIAEAKAKIEAAFAGTPEHVSATIGDIKLLAVTLLEHLVSGSGSRPAEPLPPAYEPPPAEQAPPVSDGGGAPPPPDVPPASDGGGAPPPPATEA